MPAASTPESVSRETLDELETIFRSGDISELDFLAALERLLELPWAGAEAERVLEVASLAALHSAANAPSRGKAWLVGAKAARAKTRFKLAIELVDKSRREFRSVRDSKGTADCDLVAGAIRTETGRPAAALRSYRRAEKTFGAIGDARGAAACIFNRGLIHFQRTELQEALDCYLDAERAFAALGLRLQAAICRMSVGNVHNVAGRYEDALQTFAAVRPEFDALGDSDRAARCRLNAGNAFAGSGNYLQAIGMFRGAGEVFRTLGNERLEAACLLNASVAATELGKTEQATEDVLRALVGFRAVEDAMGQGECHLILSRLRGSPEDAASALALFSRVGDKLQMAAAHISSAKLTPTGAERHWRLALGTVSSALKGTGGAQLRYVAAETSQEIGAALVSLELERGNVQEAGQVAETADVLATRRSAVSAGFNVRFVVDHDRLHRLNRADGEWSAATDSVPQTELRQMCKDLSEALSHPGVDTEALRRRLFQLLFGAHRTNAPVSVAAGTPLDGLAFEALLDDEGRCLIERHPIVHGRAIGPDGVRLNDCLAVTRSQFGSHLSTLPGVESEVDAIRDGGPAVTWLHQESASVSDVMRRMAKVDLIHFATHAIEDAKNPLASCLMLEPDGDHPSGRLYARDIGKLRLRAKLVVLSACETASGPQSLARAFLDAGAERVVAAAWRAENVAAKLWMSHFYGELFEAGNCNRAHQVAAKSMIESDLRDPHFWALWRVMC